MWPLCLASFTWHKAFCCFIYIVVCINTLFCLFPLQLRCVKFKSFYANMNSSFFNLGSLGRFETETASYIC